jgi:hypothetical protein
MKLVILLADVIGSDTWSEGVCWGQNERQVYVLRFWRAKIITDAEDLRTSNHLINSPESKFGHDGAQLVCNVIKEVDYVFRGPLELLPQLGILGGDTDGTGILNKY